MGCIDRLTQGYYKGLDTDVNDLSEMTGMDKGVQTATRDNNVTRISARYRTDCNSDKDNTDRTGWYLRIALFQNIDHFSKCNDTFVLLTSPSLFLRIRGLTTVWNQFYRSVPFHESSMPSSDRLVT